MTFSAEIEKLAEQLIQAKYKNACELFGEKYYSKREACDVLDEEVEVVKSEVEKLSVLLIVSHIVKAMM